jgi:hypothetical protein
MTYNYYMVLTRRSFVVYIYTQDIPCVCYNVCVYTHTIRQKRRSRRHHVKSRGAKNRHFSVATLAQLRLHNASSVGVWADSITYPPWQAVYKTYQPKFRPHLVGKACENSIPSVLIPHFLSVKWLVCWWYHPENCRPLGHFPTWDCNVFVAVT